MPKFKLKSWELALVIVASLIFSVSFGIFVTDFPIRNYIFGIQEVETGVVVGNLKEGKGSIRRAVLGDTEFKEIYTHAKLYNMDVLVVGPSSSAVITLENGAVLELGPESMIRLAFSTDYAVTGINRFKTVELIAGNLKAIPGPAKFLIVHEKKSTVVDSSEKQERVIVTAKLKSPLTPQWINILNKRPTPPKNLPLPQALPRVSLPAAAPTPTPTPSPTPTPTPTETPLPTPTTKQVKLSTEELNRVKITESQVEADYILNPKTSAPEKVVKLAWKMYPADGSALVHIQMTYDAQGKPSQQTVFKAEVKAKGLRGELKWTAKSPGAYVWRITKPDGGMLSSQKNTVSSFQVLPELTMIQLIDPLVGGLARASSNRLTGDLMKNFDITFRWEPCCKLDQYQISFGKSRADTRSLFSKTVKKAEYMFNKNKLFVGTIFYQVSGKLPSGYLAVSEPQQFSFNFLPPALVSPPSQYVFQRSSKAGAKGLLLTWQKTNFTTGYELQVSKNELFTDLVVKKEQKENYYFFKNPQVGQYWWRARSFNPDSSSQLSSPYTFKVEP